jgi:hypothetical protein
MTGENVYRPKLCIETNEHDLTWSSQGDQVSQSLPIPALSPFRRGFPFTGKLLHLELRQSGSVVYPPVSLNKTLLKALWRCPLSVFKDSKGQPMSLLRLVDKKRQQALSMFGGSQQKKTCPWYGGVRSPSQKAQWTPGCVLVPASTTAVQQPAGKPVTASSLSVADGHHL